MIKKYKQFNEGILDKLTGPSEEEFWNNIKGLHPTEKLRKSIGAEYLYGINYALNHGAELNQLGIFLIRKLLRILNNNDEKELLFKCIEDYYDDKNDKTYYYLFSCMYGYLNGVKNGISKVLIKSNYFSGLELAIKFNRLNIVDFLITKFESTSTAYDWESKAKEYAEKYNNREVLDYFLKRGY